MCQDTFNENHNDLRDKSQGIIGPIQRIKVGNYTLRYAYFPVQERKSAWFHSIRTNMGKEERTMQVSRAAWFLSIGTSIGKDKCFRFESAIKIGTDQNVEEIIYGNTSNNSDN